MSTGKQGRWQRVRTPVKKKIEAPPPPAKADRLKINRKNCQLQSDLGLFSRVGERQKHVWYSRAPVDYTGSPLPRLVGTAGNSLPTFQRTIKSCMRVGRAKKELLHTKRLFIFLWPLASDISPVKWYRTTSQKTWMFKCHKTYAEDVSPVYISINHNTHLLSGALAPNASSDAVKCKNISWVFENWVLWRTSGLKAEDVKGSWRDLHNKDLCDLRSTPDIVWLIETGSVRCM